MAQTVCIARWDEDVSWTKRLPQGWDTLLVQKERDLPNVGREPASFFWAIYTLYPTIQDDDTLAFVQGDPNGNGPFGAREDVVPSITEVETFTPLGSWNCICDGEGRPYHPGLPLKEKYETWLGRPFPGKVTFVAGGQFVLPGREILRHPREYYQAMIYEMFQGENPYCMERLWESLFSDEQTQPQTPRPPGPR